MDLLDELHDLLDRPVHADTFAYFSQDEMPVADFDQKDFSLAAPTGRSRSGGGSRRRRCPASAASSA